LFDACDTYRVEAQSVGFSGCTVHAAAAHDSEEVDEPMRSGEEFAAEETGRDATGLVWVRRQGTTAGGGQCWISVLSRTTGAVQLRKMPRRMPIQYIAAGGNRSIAFGGEPRAVRNWLAQLETEES
jgi:hypothetical protein